MFLSSIRKWLERPVRFDYVGEYLLGNAKVLDVGCGDKSPEVTLSYYPSVEYSGIDNRKVNTGVKTKKFFLCDVEGNDLKEIPNNEYNVLLLSHIIEHVSDGERLLSVLAHKLKKGGIIYVETPTERSLRFPSWYGTLNFFDDPTHKKIYAVKAIESILRSSGFSIIGSGTRRNLKRILLSPLYAVLSLIRDKRVNATVVWDLVGFAGYVLAQKQ